uniref:Uncharacterized protein n=1 Tax=Oryza brachyantha TaxID=4533 RepID=J3LHA3_ORYBR
MAATRFPFTFVAEDDEDDDTSIWVLSGVLLDDGERKDSFPDKELGRNDGHLLDRANRGLQLAPRVIPSATLRP